MFKEMIGDSFSILEKFAPTIATAVGSPAAGAATMFGLNLLSTAFGVPANNIGSALRADPAVGDRLTQLEQTFAPWFKNNAGQFKMPSSIEIKMTWDNQN